MRCQAAGQSLWTLKICACGAAADGAGVRGVQQRQVVSAEVALLSSILDKVAPYKAGPSTSCQHCVAAPGNLHDSPLTMIA